MQAYISIHVCGRHVHDKTEHKKYYLGSMSAIHISMCKKQIECNKDCTGELIDYNCVQRSKSG